MADVISKNNLSANKIHMMDNLPVPCALLANFGRKFDSLWRKIDEFRASLEKNKGMWDRRVFVPFNEWSDFARKLGGVEKTYDGTTRLLACLASWRPTQDIIEFNPELMKMLEDTRLPDLMPAETLSRLPAWCIYVETPGIRHHGYEWDGFFANLDLCHEPGLMLLGIYFANAKRFEIMQVFLPLGNWSFEKSIKMINDDFKRVSKKLNLPMWDEDCVKMDSGLSLALNLLILICSFGFQEYSPENGRATGKKIKGITRFFPPDKPVRRKFGYSVSDRITHAGNGIRGEKKSPRPHIRRPHWHSYWTGKGTSRKIMMKWLPPISVSFHFCQK